MPYGRGIILDFLFREFPSAILFPPNIVVITVEVPFLAVQNKQFVRIGINAMNARVAFFYFFKNI